MTGTPDQETTPAEPALLDPERVAVIRELYGTQRRAQLFELFRKQANEGREAIRQGLDAGDRATIARAAHRLASSAASFACRALHAEAVRLARADAPDNQDDLEQAWRELEACHAASVDALQRELELDSPRLP
ncbi:MAG: Hpt domain-containing protein [Pseudomonadota bacterium]